MRLVITEKPKTAKPFANILGCTNKQTQFNKGTVGYFESPDGKWIVTWMFGHLMRAKKPDEIDARYKRWSYDNLPIILPSIPMSPIKQSPQKEQFEVIRDLLNRDDIEVLYVATDADREGQGLCQEVLDYCKPRCGDMRRIWYTNVMEDTLKKALKEAKPLSDYEGLSAAASARSEADYTIGMSDSRLISTYTHQPNSVGRVISPTVYLIVEREETINNFVPEEYGVVTATLTGKESPVAAKARFDSIDKATQIKDSIKGHPATVKLVEKKSASDKRMLYDLTSLQSDASKKFGYTASDTLSICQALYDNGFLSYPRTNSNAINEEQIVETEPLLLEAWRDVFGQPHQVDTTAFDINRIVQKKGEGAEASHTGLCPTSNGIKAYQSSIKKDEKQRNIFLLVSCRLLCSCLPENIKDKTKVVFDIDGEDFTANGSVTTQDGFLPFEQYIFSHLKMKKQRKAAGDQVLPPLIEGDVLTVSKTKLEQKKTKPPTRYTEASLLEAMKNIASVLPEKKMKDILRSQDAGLGTQASRDQIIDNMKRQGYVEVQRGYFIPTPKAIHLMSVLPEAMKSPVLTANMELSLDDIAKGHMSKADFMKTVHDMAREHVRIIQSLPPIPDTDRYKNNKTFVANGCPKCGADVVETDKSMVCRHNCGFIVWREVAHKKITKEELKALISTGMTTKKIDGLKKKAGGTFECWLYLDSDGKVAFDFDDAGRKATSQNYLKLQSNISDNGDASGNTSE